MMLPGCEKPAVGDSKPEKPDFARAAGGDGEADGSMDPASRLRREADMPLLTPKEGDTWRYRVALTNPKDSRTGALVEAEYEMTRVFVGEREVMGKSYPCFELRSADGPVVREFVEIEEDRILLRGQGIRLENGGTGAAMVFDSPVLFVRAGLSGGESLPLMELSKEPLVRRMIRVIAREKVEVPAGVFTDSIRMQMVGVDGGIGLRHTFWFVPGTGLVKEEIVRETKDALLLRERRELLSGPATGAAK
jgi:hypothetical protein